SAPVDAVRTIEHDNSTGRSRENMFPLQKGGRKDGPVQQIVAKMRAAAQRCRQAEEMLALFAQFEAGPVVTVEIVQPVFGRGKFIAGGRIETALHRGRKMRAFPAMASGHETERTIL